jgi:uncharacterized protein (DUF362 family)/Pyruvate/2-oxoacid:ferredoxin oxidoreductase delta subunit
MQVAAVKVASYRQEEVECKVNQVLAHIGGMHVFVNSGEKILIKANMLEGVPAERAVTTHPEVVRAVIREVRKAGGIPFVGDSPGTSGTLRTAEKCGIAAVCREEIVEVLDFEGSMDVPYPAGATVKKFSLTSALRKTDKVISLAKLKTHTFMGMTGATKNMFGCVVGMNKAQYHLRMQARKEFAGMLIDLAALVKPVLSIVDGVVGMEGNGPRNGKPRQGGVFLAGPDPLAVDVVMATMMGFDPARLPVTALALERGLVASFPSIEVLGDARDIRLGFKPPRSMENLEDRVPAWIARWARNHLTARPYILDACVGCGRCAAHCPPRAMSLAQNRVWIDAEKCIRCYCCQELCPHDAVDVRETLILKAIRAVVGAER